MSTEWPREKWLCYGCQVKLGDGPVIQDHLWKTICPNPHGGGLLCISCMEKRRDRPLHLTDLKEVDWNDNFLPLFRRLNLVFETARSEGGREL